MLQNKLSVCMCNFKVQIKPDYSLQSQAELRNSNPPVGVAPGKY